MLFWNKLTAAIFESILVVGLSGFITFSYNFGFSTNGQSVQSWSALICAIFYLVIPLYCFVRLFYNFDKAHEDDLAERIGFLYEGLAIKRGILVTLEPITFLLRRLVLAILVIYGTEIFFY